MSIFISAGHHSKATTIKQDPGAVNKQGIKEGDLTIEFRDLVCKELTAKGVKFVTDTNEETLSAYLKRIQTGTGSVVVEYHFDANDKPTPTGTTGLIEGEADRLDRAFAKELTDATASILGIKNRGVIDESQSHRGRLGLMREEGIICLMEICFITNPDDLKAYNANKLKLAKAHADILIKYEGMI
jgi:N-acetylmuramoyl-L-alanine amidase